VEDQVAIPDVIVDLEGNVVPWACAVDPRVLDLHRRNDLDEVGGVTANVDLVAQAERRAQADCGNRAMLIAAPAVDGSEPSLHRCVFDHKWISAAAE